MGTGRGPAGALIRIEPLTATLIPTAIACAERIWPAAYDDLLPDGQVPYMLAERTRADVLATYVGATDRWYDTAWDAESRVGYVSSSLTGPRTLTLEQLYVVPERWGSGVAEELISTVLGHGTDHDATTVTLTVNRGNGRALAFYRRMGFAIGAEQVTDIGSGYMMDDYVLERPIDRGPTTRT